MHILTPATATQLLAWIRENVEAKGWDDKTERPLKVKSDLCGHGGRALRPIAQLEQLSEWAIFWGEGKVRAGDPVTRSLSSAVAASVALGSVRLSLPHRWLCLHPQSTTQA